MNADSQGRDSGTLRDLPRDEQVDLTVEVFRMLADATRVRLSWALLHTELPVNELAVAVGVTEALMLHHIADLEQARAIAAA